MEENKKPETTSQQDSAPADYSRYMGTLNRIYRRNNNPKKKRLGDGITSLKQEQKPTAPAKPENGKKDHSFLITLAVAIAIILILWVIKKVLNHTKNTARNDLPLSFRAVWQEGSATVDVKSGETIKRSHSGMQQFLLMRRSHPHPQP